MAARETKTAPETESYKKRNKGRWGVTALFILYLGAVFFVTFLAWNYGSSYSPAGEDGRNLNVVPFLSIHNIYTYSTDIMVPIRILLGNIVMFIPFGFLLPLVYSRWRGSYLGILPTAFIALMASVAIEVNQYFFTYRVANVDDVILNTAGGLIGAVIYDLMRRMNMFYVKRKRS
ncbi:VanZ family protein [Alteribacter natronophilus]|uniref:VanZ family protein n=1 Tax=Alteribacter natronophilus TaxID=2583810 RepID=UPI00110EEDE1|nr:VanZ family protein [Alteribacter natronophilus]TMW73332.1 VanZ family protein [Alteribacter natronophilus]